MTLKNVDDQRDPAFVFGKTLAPERDNTQFDLCMQRKGLVERSALSIQAAILMRRI